MEVFLHLPRSKGKYSQNCVCIRTKVFAFIEICSLSLQRRPERKRKERRKARGRPRRKRPLPETRPSPNKMAEKPGKEASKMATHAQKGRNSLRRRNLGKKMKRKRPSKTTTTCANNGTIGTRFLHSIFLSPVCAHCRPKLVDILFFFREQFGLKRNFFSESSRTFCNL